MAHKKGVGSSRNGRDSNPKYRGIKKYGGEQVIPGNIIVLHSGLIEEAVETMRRRSEALGIPALAPQFTPLDSRGVHPGLPME